MNLFLVITPDKTSGALVTMDEVQQKITVHPFIYPEDVVYSFSYHFPRVPFEQLPDVLKGSDYLPFNSSENNFWYNLSIRPAPVYGVEDFDIRDEQTGEPIIL